jgi:hypothetical protein
MSIGSSGRIVIEVEPDVKRHLYSALAKDGMSLKEWFLRHADAYLAAGGQIPLPLPDNAEVNTTRKQEQHDSMPTA